ncbi:hypothetical protein [Hymenobacter terrenus]|uniref:hypothetical protein n=1 Tax=Hymenobacter terrenus TaxID=1629124 RepID=UPI0006197D90|nr:hypothetical protein [Hymenobacter terrenus]
MKKHLSFYPARSLTQMPPVRMRFSGQHLPATMQSFSKGCILKAFVHSLGLSLLTAQLANAQVADWKQERSAAVLFGLSQPLLVSGFNIEGNYIHNRFLFDYSHGTSLDFNRDVVTDELKSQGVVVHMPWTTGFGVGYRLREWVNLRVEPKWHKFEYYYDGDTRSAATQITSNTTFSLGLGLYGRIQPFKKQGGILRGLTLAPSIRYWPTVRSSFSNDKFAYQNKNLEKPAEIKTLDPGIGFSPVVLNLSVGYTLDLPRRR